MNITINWDAVAVLATLALAWSGFLVAIIRWLVSRAVANIEERLSAASNAAKAATTGLQKHQEEYLRFLGTLPVDYYRREDMIRFETTTHAKLDALAGFIRQLECHKCQIKPH